MPVPAAGSRSSGIDLSRSRNRTASSYQHPTAPVSNVHTRRATADDRTNRVQALLAQSLPGTAGVIPVNQELVYDFSLPPYSQITIQSSSASSSVHRGSAVLPHITVDGQPVGVGSLASAGSGSTSSIGSSMEGAAQRSTGNRSFSPIPVTADNAGVNAPLAVQPPPHRASTSPHSQPRTPPRMPSLTQMPNLPSPSEMKTILENAAKNTPPRAQASASIMPAIVSISSGLHSQELENGRSTPYSASSARPRRIAALDTSQIVAHLSKPDLIRSSSSGRLSRAVTPSSSERSNRPQGPCSEETADNESSPRNSSSENKPSSPQRIVQEHLDRDNVLPQPENGALQS